MGIPLRALVQLAVFLVICLGLLSALVGAAFADPPQATAAPEKKNLQYYVSVALTQAFDEFAMGAAQKRVFDAEVASDGLPFVTSYSTTHEGTDVQVDKEKLKNYLRFFPGLFSGTMAGDAGSINICVTTLSAAGCDSCAKFEPRLQTGLTIRLERHGFSAKQGPSVSGEASVSGEKAFEYVVARAAEARCDGTVYAELALASDDTEGPGDKVRVSSFMQLKDKQGRKIRSRSQLVASLGALDDKTTVSIIGKQTAELFSAAAAQSSGVAQQAAETSERYVRLESIPNFHTYARFKQTVTSALPEMKFEERFISPGRVQFAISSDAAMPKVAEQLKQLSWGGLKLDVMEVTQNELAVALRGEAR